MAIQSEIMKEAEGLSLEALQIVRDLCHIPAPSGHEEKRAEYCKNYFEKNGFKNVFTDDALNVLAPVNLDLDGNDSFTVMMAHTDTVFPDMTPMPVIEQDGFIYSPGVCDDTANLAVLMVCAKYYKDHLPENGEKILFVANSCEEGLGNLKGSRKIMEVYGKRVEKFVSLDSACMHRMVSKAVGSHRYKVSVATEGGHSFGNFGNRNAIHTLASMIDLLYTVKVPREGDSITTYNVGLISGGTSVNTIAQNAEMMYEYRSDNKECLAKMKNYFEHVIETFRASGVSVEVEKVGDRPCADKIADEDFLPLKNRYMASLKEVLGMDGEERSGSTDCNIPLSMKVPAICFGVCRGGGCHTREEKLESASLLDGTKLFLDFLYRQ